MSAIRPKSVIVLLCLLLISVTAALTKGQDCNCVWGISSWEPSDGLPEDYCPPYGLRRDPNPTNPSLPPYPSILGDYLIISTTHDSYYGRYEVLSYSQWDSILAVKNEWIIEFEVRLVEESDEKDNFSPCLISFVCGKQDDNKRPGSILWIEQDTTFLWESSETRGATAAIDNSVFRKYRIIVDLVSRTAQVNFWNTSTLIWESLISEDLYDFGSGSSDSARIGFGDGTQTEGGISHWKYFKHNGFHNEDIHVTRLADDDSDGSLRWAINQANDGYGSNTIVFDVSGTISLTAPLPALTDDCTSIIGNRDVADNPDIYIDGTALTDPLVAACLEVNSNYNVIRNLGVDADRDCIKITGEYNQVAGCYIGISQDGSSYGKADRGIIANGDNNTIGGLDDADGNVIAGYYGGIVVGQGPYGANYNQIMNNLIGLPSTGSGSLGCPGGPGYNCQTVNGIWMDVGSGNWIGSEIPGTGNVIGNCEYGISAGINIDLRILGNYIGVDATGNTAAPNGTGIALSFGRTFIGNAVGTGNVISGNTEYGIVLSGDSCFIIDNKIGVGADGSTPVGNGLDGIWNPDVSSGVKANVIDTNIIAYNGGAGIRINPEVFGSRTFIKGNRIKNNAGLGIDLGETGVTANSGTDIWVDFPVIDAATCVESSPGLYTYTVTADVPVGAYVEVYFASEDGSPGITPEHGEGYDIFKAVSDNDMDGRIEFELTVDIPFVPSRLTATATIDSSTSEYSANYPLSSSGSMMGYSPINMIVQDPDGLQFGLDADGNLIDEIPGAEYYTVPEDSIFIPSMKIGEYTLTYVRENGSSDPDLVYSSALKIAGLPHLMIAVDKDIPDYGEEHTFTYSYETGFHYLNGDANRDNVINVGDAVFIINYVFKSGPAPEPLLAGDANCDVGVNVGDAVYLINHVFKNGEAPCYYEP